MQPTAETLKKELTRAKINVQCYAVTMLSLGAVVALWGRSNSADMREISQWFLIFMWLFIIGGSLWERSRYVKLLRDLETPADPLPGPQG